MLVKSFVMTHNLSDGFEFLITRILSEVAKGNYERTRTIIKALMIYDVEQIEEKLRNIFGNMEREKCYDLYNIFSINMIFKELGYEKPFIQQKDKYESNFVANGQPYYLLISKAMKAFEELYDLISKPRNMRHQGRERFNCCLKFLEVKSYDDIEQKLRELIQEKKHDKVNMLFGFLGLEIPFVQINDTWYKNY